MMYLQRQIQAKKPSKAEAEAKRWEDWKAWLHERQNAIDDAHTTEQKLACATRYQRSWQGRI